MSNTTKHTPGPWKVSEDIEGLWIQPKSDFDPVICDMVSRKTNTDSAGFHAPDFQDEDYANANLIAAAPELLEALVSLTDHLYDAGFLRQDFPNEWKTVQLPPLFNKAMLAIKKAQP